jgi:hypothetical protein
MIRTVFREVENGHETPRKRFGMTNTITLFDGNNSNGSRAAEVVVSLSTSSSEYDRQGRRGTTR